MEAMANEKTVSNKGWRNSTLIGKAKLAKKVVNDSKFEDFDSRREGETSDPKRPVRPWF